MNWETGLKVKGAHSFLSPSSPHWVNYDSDKLAQAYENHRKAVLGTRIHALADEHIKLKIRMPNTTASLNAFVNDAIGFKMESELLLYYSDNAFGTVDAISFHDNVLRVHDLKTGTAPGKKTQLEVYAALFCLQYKYKPENIEICPRIYQYDEIAQWTPDPKYVFEIMQVIKRHNKQIDNIKGIYD